MRKIKESAFRFPSDLVAGWVNWYRLTAKAMASSSVSAVLLTYALWVFIGAGFIGLGDMIAGEPGAWLGAMVGLFAGGVFIGRVLDQL